MAAAEPRFFQPIKLNRLVLVVEADEDTRLMMQYLLQMWSYTVIETADVEEALIMTEAEQPDVILISGRVQQDDSLTTIRRMRELSPFGKAEIIYISAYSEPTVRTSALAAGADDFLIKPIDFGQLERMLEQNLQTASKRKEMFL